MDFSIRTATPAEQMYSYSQSGQIEAQTGCIGHLRADFGSDGNSFYSSWADHNASLKDQAFKDEFDHLIGLDRLHVIHLNNSKNVRGARKDRHANIGDGMIGFDVPCNIAHNPRIAHIPKILETPYSDGKPPYKEEIQKIVNKA